MLFMFRCSECEREIRADSSMSGQRVDCPSCGVQTAVPFAKLGPGATVGEFRLTRLLGKGGMGEVYLATQLSMDRQVAVKILPDIFTANRNAVDRFLREARLAARLDHPNAATIYAAGEDDGIYYLAMEYIDGESLDIRLKRRGAFSETEALDIVLKAARALGYAWGTHQILHRDLKPANIMVTEVGAVKLVDLGLAKAILEEGTVTMTGLTVGTPAYMSPEQINDVKDVDQRSDIYSLGTTLYHLLTGECPFPGSSVARIFNKVLHASPPPIRERHPDVSPQCVALVEQMMRKDRKDRPQEWTEVIAGIEEILTAYSSVAMGAAHSRVSGAEAAGQAHPPTSRPVREIVRSTRLDRLWGWGLQHRKLIGFGLAATAVAVILSALALRQKDQPEKTAAQTPEPAVITSSEETGSSPPPTSDMTAASDKGEHEANRASEMEPLPRAPENFVYGYFFFYPQTTDDPTFYIKQMADFSNTAVFYPEYNNIPAMLAALRRNDLRVISGTTLRRGATRWFAEYANGMPVMEYARSFNSLMPGLLDRYIRARKRLTPDSPIALLTDAPSSFPQVEPLPFAIPAGIDIVVRRGTTAVWDDSGKFTAEELRSGTAAWMREACREAGGRPVIACGEAADWRLDSPLVRNARPFVAGAVEGGASGVLWWNIWAPKESGYGAVDIPGLLETHRQIARELGVRKLPPDFFNRFLRPMPEPEDRGPSAVIPETNELGLWFDGKDDTVVIPSYIYDGSHPITLETVVRIDPSGTAGFTFVISSCQGGGLWIARTAKEWNGAANDGSAYREIRSNVSPTDRQTHVALVLADKTLRLYVDGSLQGGPLQLTDFFPSYEPFMIGADPSSSMRARGKFFQGTVEEVRISRVARYETGGFAPRIPMPVDDDTVVMLRFEEGEGELAHDASGNGNDGFIRGATWRRLDQPPPE